MEMKSSHVMDIAQLVPLKIGDKEPGENQILISSVILIQLHKLLSMGYLAKKKFFLPDFKNIIY